MTKSINNPRLVDVKNNGKNSATFVIEPLFSGYGNTLGNSMRRVLLSSIEGSAIVAFGIDGVSHEFTTIKGIKEDVIEIMLNLKGVAVKSFADKPVELVLEKKGAGEVTAKDIKTTADVEIIDPNALICTIDDPKGKIKMNLMIDNGRGYRTIEQSSESRVHSNMIALDAMFTPVLRVRYDIKSTRVGQNTDLDKLSLTIDTDGSITPKEAFEEAAAILVNQYTALAGSTVIEASVLPGGKEETDNSMLAMSLEDLNLSVRTYNALINGDISTIGEMINAYNSGDLDNLKGFGETARKEVEQRIGELEF